MPRYKRTGLIGVRSFLDTAQEPLRMTVLEIMRWTFWSVMYFVMVCVKIPDIVPTSRSEDCWKFARVGRQQRLH